MSHPAHRAVARGHGEMAHPPQAALRTVAAVRAVNISGTGLARGSGFELQRSASMELRNCCSSKLKLNSGPHVWSDRVRHHPSICRANSRSRDECGGRPICCVRANSR